jgi:phospholipid/cholesterol/gamma-HCH transport system substrate-binding protein
METKANYSLIGLFTLAVIVGVFGFVYWFQSIGGTGERTYYQIVFDGSVSGLRTGGSVLFNGIRVGEVTGLKLNPDKPQQVIATISVDKSVAIRPDVQIGLEFQGLTGIASIALKGGGTDQPILVGSKENPPTLTAPPNATADITTAARETLRKLDVFLVDNQEAFHDAIANIDKFSASLARNSERIDKITAGLQDLTGGEDGKGGELNATVRDVRETVRSIHTLADNLDRRTEEITKGINLFTATGTRQLNAIGGDARRTLAQIEVTFRNLDRNPSRLLFGGPPQGAPRR